MQILKFQVQTTRRVVSSGKKRNCKKGYPCGRSCINRTRNCRNPLEGQAKNFADWLKRQQITVGLKPHSPTVGQVKPRAKPVKESKSNLTSDDKIASPSEVRKLIKQWDSSIRLISREDRNLSKLTNELGEISDDLKQVENEKQNRSGGVVSLDSLDIFDNPDKLGRTRRISNLSKLSKKKLLEEEKLLIKERDELAQRTASITEKKLKKLKQLGAKSEDVLSDSAFVSSQIRNQVTSKTNIKTLGVKDSKGRLQAALTYEVSDLSLSIEYLATAPWNMLDKHPNKTRGAGSQAIELAVLKSIELGKEGRISLIALDNAKGFYKKMGFVENEGGTFELSSKSAKEFLKSRNVTNFNELTLEELEEKAGSGLAAPVFDIEFLNLVKKYRKEIKLRSHTQGYKFGMGRFYQ